MCCCRSALAPPCAGSISSCAHAYLVQLDLGPKLEVGVHGYLHLIKPYSTQQLVLRHSAQEVQPRVCQPVQRQRQQQQQPSGREGKGKDSSIRCGALQVTRQWVQPSKRWVLRRSERDKLVCALSHSAASPLSQLRRGDGQVSCRHLVDSNTQDGHLQVEGNKHNAFVVWFFFCFS